VAQRSRQRSAQTNTNPAPHPLQELERLLSAFQMRYKMQMPTGDGMAISFYDLYQ
jgi:ribosomal protein L13E